MPTLEKITIYPVKSLDGLDLGQCGVLPARALENDRRWRLVDMDGRVINAKRSPLFSAIRAEFDLSERLVALWLEPAALTSKAFPETDLVRLRSLAGPSDTRMGRESFHLEPGKGGPCGWLSEVFGVGVLLQERADGGFPDDRDAAGPTLISSATLTEVARWFGFDLAEARRRFRVNLEIGDCDACWEDTLASPVRPQLPPSVFDLPAELAADPYADRPPPEPRDFSISDIKFRATNVCRRCVVPTRDSRTGAVTEHFRDAFEARRGRGMRADVDASGWGSLYRLAINTRLLEAPGGVLAVGSPLATH